MLESKPDSNRPASRVTREDIEAFFARVSTLRVVYEELATAKLDAKTQRTALQLLQTAHEELMVAGEELTAQNEQLHHANRVVEVERQRYRDIFDCAPDPHMVTDRMGVIHDVNAAALELFGGDALQIRGKPLALFAERDHVKTLRDAITRAAQGTPVDANVKLGDRKLESKSVRLRGRLTSNPHSILWVAAITERPISGVFDAVPPRDKPAPEGNGAPTEHGPPMNHGQRALAVLSHELRGPLHAVLGWTSLLREGRLSAKDRDKALAVIERNVMTQAAIVEGLLDVSRLTTHGLEIDRSVIDLSELVTFAADAVRPAATAADVFLHMEIEPSVKVVGDETRLTQIAMNLLSNALKFTPAKGFVTARVRARRTQVVFSVTDTGRGIRQEALTRIFECFEQDQDGQKSGVGLGLFLVKELVQLHGGTVEALSEGLGCGATFIVKLPLHVESEASEQP